jgi:hypothetical protein
MRKNLPYKVKFCPSVVCMASWALIQSRMQYKFRRNWGDFWVTGWSHYVSFPLPNLIFMLAVSPSICFAIGWSFDYEYHTYLRRVKQRVEFLWTEVKEKCHNNWRNK